MAPCRNTSVCLQVKTHTHTRTHTEICRQSHRNPTVPVLRSGTSCSYTAAVRQWKTLQVLQSSLRNPVKTSLSELERCLSSTKVRKDPGVLHEFSYIFRGREQKRQEIPAGLEQAEERVKLGGSVKYPLGAFEPVGPLSRRDESSETAAIDTRGSDVPPSAGAAARCDAGRRGGRGWRLW